MTGKPIGNYTVTKSPGTDTVTAAPSGTGITPTYLTGANTSAGLGAAGYILNAAATFTGTATSGSASVTGIASTAGLVVGEQITSSILGSGVTIKTINSGTAITLSANTTAAGTVTFTAGTAAATYAISVGSLVTAGKGTPTGTVTVYDTFVPITPTVFVPTSSTGAVPTFCSATLTTNCVSTVVPVLPCAGGVTTNCNPPVVVTLGGTLSAPTPGLGTFVMPSTYPNYTAMGTHYFSFLYSGDAGTNGDGLGDFACSVVGQAATTTPACPSTGAVPSALIVDGPDFTLTSNTGPIIVNPGVVPSGNGLPGTSTTVVQSTVLQIAPILGFSGLVNLSCVTQNLAYVHCSVGQTIVVNNASQLVTYATIASGTTTSVVFDVYTPASLPIGFNTTGQLRTSATRTVLAFLPFGILAFCVRRRRRLSKALWVLIAIAAVSAGMSGCGGNQVDFYTPIPTGPQTVTVTASYTPPGGSTPTLQRSFVVPININ
jgi:hypothetical protein